MTASTGRTARWTIATATIVAAIAWPFFHNYMEVLRSLRRPIGSSTPVRETGIDWHSLGFWSFCLVVVGLVTAPETKAFTGRLVSGFVAWRKK